jgi:hypothetical protein
MLLLLLAAGYRHGVAHQKGVVQYRVIVCHVLGNNGKEQLRGWPGMVFVLSEREYDTTGEISELNGIFKLQLVDQGQTNTLHPCV